MGRVSSSNKYQTFAVLIVCVFVLPCELFMPGSVRTVEHAEMFFHSQLISFGKVRLILDRLLFYFRAYRPCFKCHCRRELQAEFTVALPLNFGIIILTQQITELHLAKPNSLVIFTMCAILGCIFVYKICLFCLSAMLLWGNRRGRLFIIIIFFCLPMCGLEYAKVRFRVL